MINKNDISNIDLPKIKKIIAVINKQTKWKTAMLE